MKYESRVIAKLVEAAQKRQVIVFAHRISVARISESIVDKRLFKELSLRATKDKKGISGERYVNASKSDKVLNKFLNQNLLSITQTDCDIVDKMMTKYSAYDHSMSSETPFTRI